MEEWQCFRYIEDEEFESSDDYKVCQYIINNRNNNVDDYIIDLGSRSVTSEMLNICVFGVE